MLQEHVIGELDRRLSKGRVILAIDGGSGSGKTGLAEELARRYGAAVFHMDDFFLRPEQRTPERFAEPGGNADRERFLSEVLEPLQRGEPEIRFRQFDCHSLSLLPEQRVRRTDLTIVEGSYSLHRELRDHYDLRIFLRIDPEEQRIRILRRNGEDGAEMFFRRWIPLENRYFAEMKVAECADLILEIGGENAKR